MRICLATAAVALTAFAGNPAQAAKSSTQRPQRPSVKNPTSVVRTSPQGKLVRSVVTPAGAPQLKAAQDPSSITTMTEFDRLVEELAREQQVDPLLVHAVIRVESNYNQFALSNKGAQGLMQLIPQTAREMGVANAFDKRENILGGVKYLRAMMNRFTDLRHVIAAYNAGPEAVQRYNGIPPYAETQNYVFLVAQHYNRLRREHPPVAVAPAQVQVAETRAPEPEYRPLVTFVDSDGRLHMESQ